MYYSPMMARMCHHLFIIFAQSELKLMSVN